MKVRRLLLVIFALSFTRAITLEEQTEINVNVLKSQLQSQFENSDGSNVFIAALQKLPDGEATNDDIEHILGIDYDLFKKMWASARIRGLGLVIRLMDSLKNKYVALGSRYESIFNDYFLMIQLNLTPETVFLNRDTYIVFNEIEENMVSEIYSQLTKLYTLWRPLKLIIDERRDADFEEIHKLVELKNPNYEPKQLEITTPMTLTEVEPEIVHEEVVKIEPLIDVLGVGGAALPKQSELDEDSNYKLTSVDQLRLYSYNSQHETILRERQLLQSATRMVVLWLFGGLMSAFW